MVLPPKMMLLLPFVKLASGNWRKAKNWLQQPSPHSVDCPVPLPMPLSLSFFPSYLSWSAAAAAATATANCCARHCAGQWSPRQGSNILLIFVLLIFLLIPIQVVGIHTDTFILSVCRFVSLASRLAGFDSHRLPVSM